MSELTTSSSEPDVSAAASDAAPPKRRRTVAGVVGGLLLLLCGLGLLVGGLAGIVLVHTVGMGKVFGFMIVLGAGMIVTGWADIQS